MEHTQRCQFWLPNKKRFCASSPLFGTQFCGNHKPASVEARIPCPVDPSHTILQADVVAHVKKCPFVKQIEALKSKPYYEKGINSGSDEEVSSSFRSLSEVHEKCSPSGEVEGICTRDIEWSANFKGNKETDNVDDKEPVLLRNSKSFSYADNDACSEMKRKAIFAMSGQEFHALLEKIQSAHSAICQNNIQDSYLLPDACDKWFNAKLDRRLPFQEKHAIQQASILGNLETLGIIWSPESFSKTNMHSENMNGGGHGEESEQVKSHLKVVEFGAGRGYLTHMLSDCYGIKDIVLVERRSYKFKADRTLRQTEAVNLERLRIDNAGNITCIRFLITNAEAGSVIGKGGATISDLQSQSGCKIHLSRNHEYFPGTNDRIVSLNGTISQAMTAFNLILTKLLNEVGKIQQGNPKIGFSPWPNGQSTRSLPFEDLSNNLDPLLLKHQQSLLQDVLSMVLDSDKNVEDLNLEAVESLKGFHYAAVGKHLCGPATDLALRCCLKEQNCNKTVYEVTDTGGNRPCIKGLAIATCCHHLCQWKSYVNKHFFINLGFTREEFCAVTWLTSWALDGEHCSDHSNGFKLGTDLKVCNTTEDAADFYDIGDTIRCLKPAGRAILGLKCKELLDTGRLIWLREMGFNAKLVNYVPSKVSPENRLLLASNG